MSARLRDPSFTYASLAEFISQDHAQPFSYEASVSRTTLRDMVKTASTLQQWACAIFTTFLDRTRDITFRRYEPSPENGDWLLGTCIYQPRDVGSPSWIEEYRVYRALWHLKLYADIQRVGCRMKWNNEGE